MFLIFIRLFVLFFYEVGRSRDSPHVRGNSKRGKGFGRCRGRKEGHFNDG